MICCFYWFHNNSYRLTWKVPTAATYNNLDIAEMISLLFCSYFSQINSLSAHQCLSITDHSLLICFWEKLKMKLDILLNVNIKPVTHIIKNHGQRLAKLNNGKRRICLLHPYPCHDHGQVTHDLS